MLRTTFWLALAGALASSACERAPAADAPVARNDAIQVTDDAGRAVQLGAPARRVVSLMPAVTDMILALGAADRLIARTVWDTTAQLKHLPSTGNALTPSMEWLVSLKPDLVITWPDVGSRSVVGQLQSINVPAYAAETESVADALRTIENLGLLLGLQARADSLANALQEELAGIRVAVSRAPRVRVAYILSIDPPMIAGPGTYIGEILLAAGGENIFGEIKTLWPQVNIEELMRRAPEALVVATENGADPRARLKTLPGWRELPAVKNDRVLLADPDLFNRAGPSLPRAARQVAHLLHPELVR